METQDHLNPTEEITLETVKNRAVKGVLALTGRTLVLNVIGFIAQGFLWAFLEPAQFGVFFVTSAAVNFLSYFADIGLGAALIQKKEKPSYNDFKTVFTVQEILVVLVSLILILSSRVLVKTHSLDSEAIYLLYALTFAFFLASLKNIPSIILERKLEFGKYVIPQVLEQVIYNVSVVFFAWKGFGITSFTYSVLIRGVVGVVAIYIIEPWRPGVAFSKSSLKGLLKFGIPYQINSFLSTVKDDGITIVLGGILGPAGIGILGTAQKLAQYPLRFFMDNVTKVTFPAFSRMQDDKNHLERSLARSVFFICVLVFPTLIGLVSIFPVLINIIPRYQKWAPAFLPLIFLSVNSLIAAFTTQFTNLFNSLGRIKTTFKLMVMWTILTWIFVPFLSLRFGVTGASVAYAIVALSSFVALILVKRFLHFGFFEVVGKPFVSSALMGILIFILRSFFEINSVAKFILLILLAAGFYVLFLYIFFGKSLTQDVKRAFSTLLSK